MKKAIKFVIHTLEFVLAAMFIQGGIRAFMIDDLPKVLGPLHYLANQEAIYVYGVMWFSTGASLVVAKVRRLRKLHGFSLMVMYLTCLYVLILGALINGFHLGMLTTVAIGIISAVLYLRWKYNLHNKEDEPTRVLD